MITDYCEISKKLHDILGLFLQDADCVEGSGERDGILLPFGDHVITVRMETRPREVYVSLTEENAAVCGGSVSTAGTTIQDDGFVLYVKVLTDSCLVKWVVRH